MEVLTSKHWHKLGLYDRYCEPVQDQTRFKTLIPAMLKLNYSEKAWLVFNEFGLLCIVAADCEQQALDIAVDNGALDSCWVKFEDMDAEQIEQYQTDGYVNDLTPLGSANELFNLNYISMLEYN